MVQAAIEAFDELAASGECFVGDGRSAVKRLSHGPLQGYWRLALDDGSADDEYRAVFIVLPAEQAVSVIYIGPWKQAYVARGALARLRARIRR